MSKSPTMSELISKAKNLMPVLTDGQIKGLIKANNIRSNGKLEQAVTGLTGKSESEIAAACEYVPAAASRASTKTSKKSKPKAAAAPKEKFARQGRTKRAASPIKEGPRGFRFGEVWCNSVVLGEGVALLDVHKNKLLKHAESLGINRFTKDDPSDKIAKAIAAKL